MAKSQDSSTPEEGSTDAEAEQEPRSSTGDHVQDRSIGVAAGEAAERALGVPEALIGDAPEGQP